jgi:hypothetical protein
MLLFPLFNQHIFIEFILHIAFPSLSLPQGVSLIYKYNFCVCVIPNLDPWVNQNNNDYEDTATKTISNKFENHLLSIKDERQNMIHPNSHPTYN